MEEKYRLTQIIKIKVKMTRNTRILCFQFALAIFGLKIKKKNEKKMKNRHKDNMINNNIIDDNIKEEIDEDIDKDMEIKLKLLEEIKRKRRRISPNNKLKENNKIPLLSNIKLIIKHPFIISKI